MDETKVTPTGRPMRAGPYSSLAQQFGLRRAQLGRLLAVNEGTLRRWDRGLDAVSAQHAASAVLASVLAEKAADPFTAHVITSLVRRAIEDRDPLRFLLERLIVATTVAERQGRL